MPAPTTNASDLDKLAATSLLASVSSKEIRDPSLSNVTKSTKSSDEAVVDEKIDRG